MNTYASFAGPLLMGFGAALQWMRAHESVKERWTFIIAALATVLAWALLFDWSQAPHGVAAIQLAVLQSVMWCFSSFGTILGGTFAASKASGAIGFIPPTNSK